MADIIKKDLWPGWNTVRVIGRGSFGNVYEIERELYGVKEKAALKYICIPQDPSDIDDLLNDGFDTESISLSFESYLSNIVAEYSLMRQLNGTSNVVSCDDIRTERHEDE